MTMVFTDFFKGIEKGRPKDSLTGMPHGSPNSDPPNSPFSANERFPNTKQTARKVARNEPSKNRQTEEKLDAIGSKLVKGIAPLAQFIRAILSPPFIFVIIAFFSALVGAYAFLITIESYLLSMNWEYAPFVPKPYLEQVLNWEAYGLLWVSPLFWLSVGFAILVQLVQSAYFSKMYHYGVNSKQANRLFVPILFLFTMDIAIAFNEYNWVSPIDPSMKWINFGYFVVSVFFADMMFATSMINLDMFSKNVK